ncbi:MAG: hypothetical protein KME64_10690 [Scytonematopsis contorta HA4267-MV1]|jgi:ATP-dependent RNA circularization protein (DNA/RNA ligase family)|nr:hypothetical protein [Scytonematopsis contorta HA4267-MV1]
MDLKCLFFGIEIPNSDWEETPTSVKELVEKLGQKILQSEKELADKEAQDQELLEKINVSVQDAIGVKNKTSH